MNRKSLVAAAVLGTLAGAAKAQPPVPGGVGGAGNIQRPSFSPYLNLLRSGSPALNYYGLVRPDQQFRQSITNLQGSVAANQQAIGGLQSEVEVGAPVTGHPTQFLNYGGYFLNSGPGSVGGGGPANFQPGGQAGGVMTGRPGIGGTGAGGVGTPPRRR
ncbi:hypothetical protein [Urbifossiella limnaea]|uniref:Uncharacterized protein n=1 Tax=Urbifossiella limnaea TaxID=2528023 RepID=A0A517Y2W4_9BACT|nr:hypothetical protein [Urbifossiella limnaea]QDU24156.1 hypothetical protein ETAA1_61700 [Urbifossiella limnaea]